MEGSEGVDDSGVGYFAEVDVFVWTVGYGQQARAIGESGNSVGGVEAIFQQAGAHFETRRRAGDGLDAFRKRLTNSSRGIADGGGAFLEDLPVEGDAVLAAAFENREHYGLFGGEVFFGIDAAVEGKPAFSGNDVEVGATAALPAEHEDGVWALIRANGYVGFALLHFAFELLKLSDDVMHTFKGVLTVMLQSHVDGFAHDTYTERNRAAVGVPDYAAGGLGQEHAEGVAVEEALLSEPSGAVVPAGFFVGDEDQSDSAVQWCGHFL